MHSSTDHFRKIYIKCTLSTLGLTVLLSFLNIEQSKHANVYTFSAKCTIKKNTNVRRNFAVEKHKKAGSKAKGYEKNQSLTSQSVGEEEF